MLPFSVYVSRFVARVLCWMREYSPPLLFAVALVIVSDRVRVSRGLVSVCVTPRCDEARTTIYDNVLLRKWVL